MASDNTITPIRGWAFRVARVVMFTMFAIIPVHFIFHSWRVSDITTFFAYILLLVVAVLSIIAFRFGPLAWALLAVLLHTLSAFA